MMRINPPKRTPPIRTPEMRKQFEGEDLFGPYRYQRILDDEKKTMLSDPLFFEKTTHKFSKLASKYPVNDYVNLTKTPPSESVERMKFFNEEFERPRPYLFTYFAKK